MNDSEHLYKLLTNLPPNVFRDFVMAEFSVVLDELDGKRNKTEQRKDIEIQLSALAVGARQKMEENADRITQLCDGPGQDVVKGIGDQIGGLVNREAFNKITNQYERALWIFSNDQRLFKVALDARQADIFRQSVNCYSGFMSNKSLVVKDDEVSKAAFHASVALKLGCPGADVVVQIFKRLRADAESGADVSLYQISIHHNQPPETVEYVQDSALVPQEVIRAICAHITYEPANGHLEVLSRESDAHEGLARIVADELLKHPITGERIPLKAYDYQCLAGPHTLDLAGENIAWVKVIELGYTVADHRSILVKTWAKDPDDIYTAALSLVGPSFDFRGHHLNYVRLSLRTLKVPGERARTISIVLRDDNKCNVKTKREKDRVLCDRLLAKWKLIKEIGEASDEVEYALAA